MYQKSRWYDVCFLIYGVRQTKLFVILGHFLPFYPTIDPPKSKFAKNVKNAWKYYPFTNLYHKSRSYDAWFVRYEAQETVFLSFWAVFLTLTLQTTQKVKILKNCKKNNFWRYHFTLVCHKWQSYDAWFPRYWEQQIEFFFHFGLIFALFSLLQHQQPEKPNFCQKNDKKINFLSFWTFFCPCTP